MTHSQSLFFSSYSKFFTGEIFYIGGGVSYRSVGLNAAGGEFDAKTRVICVNVSNRNAICVKKFSVFAVFWKTDGFFQRMVIFIITGELFPAANDNGK